MATALPFETENNSQILMLAPVLAAVVLVTYYLSHSTCVNHFFVANNSALTKKELNRFQYSKAAVAADHNRCSEIGRCVCALSSENAN